MLYGSEVRRVDQSQIMKGRQEGWRPASLDHLSCQLSDLVTELTFHQITCLSHMCFLGPAKMIFAALIEISRFSENNS